MLSDWFIAVMEEYKSLRAEATAARDAQLVVLRFGVTLVGILVALGAALRNDDNQLFAGIVLNAVVPIVVLFVVEIWFGEIARTVRIGNFVASIEKQLERQFRYIADRPPIGWETWLRKQTGTNRRSEQQRTSISRTIAIMGLFIVVIAGSAAAGFIFVGEKPPAGHQAPAAGWRWALLASTIVILLVMIGRAVWVAHGLRDDQPLGRYAVWKKRKKPVIVVVVSTIRDASTASPDGAGVQPTPPA